MMTLESGDSGGEPLEDTAANSIHKIGDLDIQQDQTANDLPNQTTGDQLNQTVSGQQNHQTASGQQISPAVTNGIGPLATK